MDLWTSSIMWNSKQLEKAMLGKLGVSIFRVKEGDT
jgi:hypothetical protein